MKNQQTNKIWTRKMTKKNGLENFLKNGEKKCTQKL